MPDTSHMVICRGQRYLSASLYKSLYACLFSIHCFYVCCGYEKRSISEVVKDFNNNIVLVK
jgi:hypothetical protein